MDFAIDYEQRGATPLLRVSGDLDIDTAPRLRQMVGTALQDGARSVAFDFSGLDFIDSVGLAVLMHAQKRVVERGGKVYITGAAGHTRRVFSLLQLGRIFSFCSEADLPAADEAPDPGTADAGESRKKSV